MKKNAFLSCILCMLISQIKIIPLLTLTLVCMWYEESTPGTFNGDSITQGHDTHLGSENLWMGVVRSRKL